MNARRRIDRSQRPLAAFGEFAVFAALAWVNGCSSHDAPGVQLPSFTDVFRSPPAIQAAAEAVVRIGIADELATGSFISPTGLLLTNNHVLGVDLCPKEGCYAEITIMHQRNATPEAPVTVFVVPVAVDVGLDMAVVQTYSGSRTGPKLETPHYLTIESRDPASLVGVHVNVVGHPEGALKKWTEGEVVDTSGTWIYTSAYILPGNSGSPLLDDEGHLVGLMHRGPSDQDLVSADGLDEFSIGTVSAALISAMREALPVALQSTAASTTDDIVVGHDIVYLDAHAPNAMVNGKAKPVLTSLGAACDTALARTNFESPDDLSAAVTPCLDAELWIECRTDASSGGFAVCPDDVDAWKQRFQSVYDHFRSLNGQLQLDLVTFALAALSTSVAEGASAATQSLQHALAEASPPLDFGIAQYLAAFGIGSYGGTSTVDYVRTYAKVPGYEFQATTIASDALWLESTGALTRATTLSLLQGLASDPTVDLGTKLYIENVQYQFGALR